MRQGSTSRPGPAGHSRGLRSSYARRFLGAAAGAIVVAGAWLTCVYWPLGQVVDEVAMRFLGGLNDQMRGVDRVILSAVSVPMIVALMVIAGLVAAARRRPMLGVRALLIIGLSMGTTQLLKHYVLVRPAYDFVYAVSNSLPSGHVTAAATAAVALTIVVPWRMRSIFSWLGAIWTALMGFAVVLNQWHRPADVVAAIGVVAFFALLLAPLERGESPRVGGPALRATVLVVTALAVVAVVVAFVAVWVTLHHGGWVNVGTAITAMSARGSIVGALASISGVAAILAVALATMTGVDRLRL
ncbi:MAG: phosphatase PAP2 family protein [Actinomycetaceae bacterium]|nr:phosphatase PAP2 family protein [Actinomycetaceae bacterium]MDU0971025.1 phosphatase PAP2 family protein [Actinomycetaceae bacterium]